MLCGLGLDYTPIPTQDEVLPFSPMWFDASQTERNKLMAGKSRMRPSFKKNTRRYKEVFAPAKSHRARKAA
jgi:hypothetical protein